MCAKRSSTGNNSRRKKSCFDVDIVLLELRQEFNEHCACRKKFGLCIVMQHMLYAYLDNRTLVDRRITELVDSGRLKAIRLGASEDETALVDVEEFMHFCLLKPKNEALMKKFLSVVKPMSSQVYNRQQLTEEFTENDIGELVQMGVLTRRNIIGSYWLSIPGVGKFVKSLDKGRKSLSLYLRKSKFKQLPRQNIEEKKFPKCDLSARFLIDDAIGTDVISTVESTTGAVLRLND